MLFVRTKMWQAPHLTTQQQRPWLQRATNLVVDVADVGDDGDRMKLSELLADDVEEPDGGLEPIPDRALDDLWPTDHDVDSKRLEVAAKRDQKSYQEGEVTT